MAVKHKRAVIVCSKLSLMQQQDTHLSGASALI